MPSIFRSQLGAAPLPARKVKSPTPSSAGWTQRLKRGCHQRQPKHLADALLYDGALYMH